MVSPSHRAARVLRSMAAAAVMLCAASASAFAQQASGTAIAVVQQANVSGQTGRLVLQPEATVFSGDRIETGPQGQAQIIFRDQTKLVVGPNSTMIIDAFVFNDNDTARQISINAVKGAFRFITGNSSKDAYSITTPTSTIGVRGTEFDVSVENTTGVTRVVNFEGIAIVCRRDASGQVVDPQRDCKRLEDPCTLTISRPRQDVVRYTGDDEEFRNRQLRAYFPYVRDQNSLLEPFQVDVAQCYAQTIPSNEPFIPIIPPEPPVPPGPPQPPPKPLPPTFTPPKPPTFENRHPYRPVENHGPVFRH